MNFKSIIKSCCESIGKNNNPAYVVVAIATAKGIFRPLFTMADKKESQETKKYAALREGLTEVIAIPTYLSCSYLAGKGAHLFKDPEKAKMAKHNLKFAGVCTAAVLVIPGLCSIVVNPFTDRIFHKNDKPKDKSQQHLDVVSQTENQPVFKNATKKGYLEAEEGDSIRLQQLTKTDRRGRVQKEVTPTLDTQCEQGVVVKE